MTDDIDYLSAIEEGNFVIAQATRASDDERYINEELVTCRYKNEFTIKSAEKFSIWMCHHNKLFLLLRHLSRS